jgi:Ca2+-binding RTX toxin-like protein
MSKTTSHRHYIGLTEDGTETDHGHQAQPVAAAPHFSIQDFPNTPGDDLIEGTDSDDTFDITAGGNDTVHGGGGDDITYAGGAFTADDKIDGGDNGPIVAGEGGDGLSLDGDYATAVVFNPDTIQNIEFLSLAGGHSYTLVFDDANVADDGIFTIKAGGLGAGDILNLDLGQETGANFVINCGDGDDVIVGGGGNDVIRPHEGNDSINGGGGDHNRVSFFDATNAISIDLSVTGNQDTGIGTKTFFGIQNISGSHFADTFLGDDAANFLLGNGGNDYIAGGAGDDFVEVGGFDIFNELASDIFADGGDDNDTLCFYQEAVAGVGVTVTIASSASQVTGEGTVRVDHFENLQGTAFDDALTGNSQGNVLYGADGNDTLFAGDGADVLYGDKIAVMFDERGVDSDMRLMDAETAGNDVLMGGRGDDLLDGGGGTDTADYSDATGGVTVDLRINGAQKIGGTRGKDTLISIESVTGGDFGDRLTGNAGNNVLTGLTGDDVLSGLGGDDVLLPGNGHDTVNGGAGNDTIVIATSELTAIDRIDGGSEDLGRGFGDVLALNGSGMVVFGANTVKNIEVLYLTPSTGQSTSDFDLTLSDAMVSSGRPFTVYGADLRARDSMAIDAHKETDAFILVSGGAGDDRIVLGSLGLANGGLGNDTMTAQNSVFDYLSYYDRSGAGIGVTVSLAKQGVAQNTGGAGIDTIIGFLNLLGSQYGDMLTGNAGDNVINGNGGDDVISAGKGDDLVLLADGSSTVDGGAGTDMLVLSGFVERGHGNQTSFTTGVTASLALQGSATDWGHGMLTARNFEGLQGSAFDDTLTGDAGANTLLGGAGDDRLSGDKGADVLWGDAAYLFDNGSTGNPYNFADSGAGNDRIAGGAGDDIIHPGGGIDIVSGGTGRDVFVYSSASESTGAQHDTINGFDAKQDRFDLAGPVTSVHAAITSGKLSTATFDANLTKVLNASHLDAHQAVLFTPSAGSEQGHTFLVVDLNGIAGYQAANDLVVELSGATHLGALDAGDFI